MSDMFSAKLPFAIANFQCVGSKLLVQNYENNLWRVLKLMKSIIIISWKIVNPAGVLKIGEDSVYDVDSSVIFHVLFVKCMGLPSIDG